MGDADLEDSCYRSAQTVPNATLLCSKSKEKEEGRGEEEEEERRELLNIQSPVLCITGSGCSWGLFVVGNWSLSCAPIARIVQRFVMGGTPGQCLRIRKIESEG